MAFRMLDDLDEQGGYEHPHVLVMILLDIIADEDYFLQELRPKQLQNSPEPHQFVLFLHGDGPEGLVDMLQKDIDGLQGEVLLGDQVI